MKASQTITTRSTTKRECKRPEIDKKGHETVIYELNFFFFFDFFAVPAWKQQPNQLFFG